ncbi:MAG: hypothetical protein IJD01_03150 [Clostridia bacterium]|nr:hypothetical protein [Clostridia bacterium]
MRRIACIFLSLLLLCTACASAPVFDGDGGYAFYVKNGELMMTVLDTARTVQVTSHLNWDVADPRAAGLVRLSDDHTRLFYLDAKEDNDDPVRYLYVKELRGDGATTCLDRVSGDLFDIAKDGQTALYLQSKPAGGYALYMHDMTAPVLLTERLCGFGFTAKEDMPYYVVEEDGERRYTVVKDGDTRTLTETEFETETGGRRPKRYAYEGELDTRSMGVLWADGAIVDDEFRYTGYEVYHGDRMLYFASEDGEAPYTLRQYVKGKKPQTVDAVYLLLAGYTTDGCPLYLQNICKEDRTGDLMMLRDGQTVTLDHGVSGPVSLCYITDLTDSVQKHMRWE